MNLLLNLPLLQLFGGGQGGMQSYFPIIMFGLVLVIMYFLVIRPQQKKQKETQNMLKNLQKGDKITTIGGIRGVVQSVKDDIITVRVDDNVKIEFIKSAIASVEVAKTEAPATEASAASNSQTAEALGEKKEKKSLFKRNKA
jgi:preprotein translocase subunit YajC